MICAAELRIGNWLFHTGGLGYVQVTGEMIAHIERFPDEKFMTSPPRDILKPVEITEERLVKCGFEKDWTDYGADCLTKGMFCFMETKYQHETLWLLEIRGVAMGYYKHLHQLQNLYYCLTEKELEIKEL